MLDHISSCKSPQQMMGTLVKTYLAEREGVHPEDIYVVSVMPCTAKKFEATRPEHSRNGVADVDAVLTTREFARLIDRFGIDFAALSPEGFDELLGSTSGSGDIFAASGGVMESALRSAHHLITGNDLEKIEFEDVRGFEGLKEATVSIDGNELRIAVVNTLGRARELVERIRTGEVTYHFVEIMACPGGCVGGGGQMYGFETERIKRRLESIYRLERTRPVRLSHQNKQIRSLYEAFLEKPGSHRSHELLHTRYEARRGEAPCDDRRLHRRRNLQEVLLVRTGVPDQGDRGARGSGADKPGALHLLRILRNDVLSGREARQIVCRCGAFAPRSRPATSGRDARPVISSRLPRYHD
jgi:iron only hydrogenase large subunit-like protein